MDNGSYADIIILALVAGFILLRLRSVLGQKGGGEENNFFTAARMKLAEQQEPVVQVAEKSMKPKPKDDPDSYLQTLDNPAVADAIAQIKAKDPQFNATGFLGGARMAYEMVFDAFAKGDKDTLKMLLSEPIYKEFVGEIDARVNEPHKTEATLVSVKAKDIKEAALSGNMATLHVLFETEQVSVVRDTEGKIIEGDASRLQHGQDSWVFERDVTSKNPNWKVIET